MNYSTAVFVINRTARMVVCEYDPENHRDKRVNYKTLDPSISKGDLVIVATETRHKFTIVKVIDVDIPVDFDQAGEVRWIVGKVDTSHYGQLLADEGEAIKTLQRLEQKRRATEMQKLLIGENDPNDIKGLTLYKNGDHAPTEPAPAPRAPGSSPDEGPAF